MKLTIEFDKSMMIHLLRTWQSKRLNSLRPPGMHNHKLRQRLLEKGPVCPLCPAEKAEKLIDKGDVTNIDHKVTVSDFADRVLSGELTFDEAYIALWDPSNVRAVHKKCNSDRNRKGKKEQPRLVLD